MTTNDEPSTSGRTGARQRVLGRSQILDAATRCLFEQGYDATTIRRIAGMLDCAVGSIYRYFKDKRELLLAATQAKFEPVLEHLDAGHDLQANMQMYLQHASSNAEGYRLMFWLVSIGQMSSDQGQTQSVPPVIDKIIAGWSARLGDPEVAAHCWALLHGASVLHLPLEEVMASIQQRVTQARHLRPERQDSHEASGLGVPDPFAQLLRGSEASSQAHATQTEGAMSEADASLTEADSDEAKQRDFVTSPSNGAGPYEPIARIGSQSTPGQNHSQDTPSHRDD